MTVIPTIDMAPALGDPALGDPALGDPALGDEAAALAAGRAIAEACETVGFYRIGAHGVPQQVIDDLRAEALAFFDLSDAEKAATVHPVPGTPRGLRQIGGESLTGAHAGSKPPDLKEFYHIGPVDVPGEPYYTGAEGAPYFLPNLWPPGRDGFRAAVLAYYREMSRLAARIMTLSAHGLGLPPDFFADKIDRHITAIRLNHYPAQTMPPAPGQLRAGEHTDWGTLTILLADEAAGGLEVRLRDGTWVPVEPEPGTFIVNIGDLMQRWTNDRWVSNVHRVINPPPGEAMKRRLSVGFFHHPNYDAEIAALPGCTGPNNPPRYPPIAAGPYRDLKYQQASVAA